MKQSSFPHTYVIVFILLILAGILTFILPGGIFEKQVVLVNNVERTIVVPESFHHVDAQPQGWGIFLAIFEGFVQRADIIAFILIIGASFYMINQTKAIDIGLFKLISWLKKWEERRRAGWVDELLLILLMLVFSLFGAVFGMSEETIAFVPIFVPLALRLGYDSLTGVALCFVAATLGFTGAFLNPFTIGVAQGIAQLPLFSGLEYRLLLFAIINIFGFIFILSYTRRIKKNPVLSPMFELDETWRQNELQNSDVKEHRAKWHSWIVHLMVSTLGIYYACDMWIISDEDNAIAISIFTMLVFFYVLAGTWLLWKKSIEIFIFFQTLLSMILLVLGVIEYEWYIPELTTMFLLLGLVAAAAYGFKPNEMVQHFLAGAKDIFSAAFVVGMAAGIIIVLQKGQVVDTILYYLSGLLQGNELSATTGMYVVTTLFNFIMPSGSAKAALLMPLMAPLSDMVNVSRQVAVVAFQIGDGFTNMITPVSGVLLGVLTMARIPYHIWVKWVWKFILALVLLGWILILPAIYFSWPGF
ncbi:MAG: AbgT family transporter [Bacteroidales bacterium]|nr:AbgT family transporter [Bacteroidales bacterium]